MAKEKNNSPTAKRNRANRRRGSKFEKVVADYLDHDVVPYSGSNARFGWGDVRNSIWLGECKNILPVDNRVKIKQEWISDNIQKSHDEGKLPYLAWMPSGKPTKYIILDQDTFIRLNVLHDISVEIPKVSVVAVNLFINIDDTWVKSLKTDAHVAQLKFGDLRLYMMRIEYFKSLMEVSGLKGNRQGYDIQTGTRE